MARRYKERAQDYLNPDQYPDAWESHTAATYDVAIRAALTHIEQYRLKGDLPALHIAELALAHFRERRAEYGRHAPA